MPSVMDRCPFCTLPHGTSTLQPGQSCWNCNRFEPALRRRDPDAKRVCGSCGVVMEWADILAGFCLECDAARQRARV